MDGLAGVDFEVSQGVVAMAIPSPPMARNRKPARCVACYGHRRRFTWAELEFLVIAMQVQFYRFIARPTQVDDFIFGNPDGLFR